MLLCTLVFLFYIEGSKSVPTCLALILACNPTVLNLGVFHIEVFLICSILEPILINTTRDASTFAAASSNCALKFSKLPKSFTICSIKELLGSAPITCPIFSKNNSCSIAPDPKKLKFFSKHFMFKKSLISLALLKLSCVLFVLSTYPLYKIL